MLPKLMTYCEILKLSYYNNFNMILSDDEIDRLLKKDLVKQLQDLKKQDFERAAFFYE